MAWFDHSRPCLRSGGDTPLAAAARRWRLRLRCPRNYPHLRAKRVGERNDKREFRAYLACSEQSPDAGRVAVDAPRQLGFGNTEVDPQGVEFPDKRIGLGKLTGGSFVRLAVLRVLHALRPAALMKANVESVWVHGNPPSCVAQVIRKVYLLCNAPRRGRIPVGRRQPVAPPRPPPAPDTRGPRATRRGPAPVPR